MKKLILLLNRLMNRQLDTPEPSAEVSDRSLLERIRGGNGDAATDLYHRYAERLRALATAHSNAGLTVRVDPEDIVQSVFRSFFRRAVANQYEVPEGEDLWKLLLVIALRKVRNAAAHHTAARRDLRLTVPLSPSGGNDPIDVSSDQTSLALLRMTLDEALASFPESMRSIITLRIEGHEIDEIATKTSRSKRTVERVLQRFRTRMNEILADEGNEDDPNS